MPILGAAKPAVLVQPPQNGADAPPQAAWLRQSSPLLGGMTGTRSDAPRRAARCDCADRGGGSTGSPAFVEDGLVQVFDVAVGLRAAGADAGVWAPRRLVVGMYGKAWYSLPLSVRRRSRRQPARLRSAATRRARRLVWCAQLRPQLYPDDTALRADLTESLTYYNHGRAHRARHRGQNPRQHHRVSPKDETDTMTSRRHISETAHPGRWQRQSRLGWVSQSSGGPS
jgi:hypothetical protein